MKKMINFKLVWFSLAAIVSSALVFSCFKDIPKKNIVYQNDFENKKIVDFQIYNGNGLIDTVKIVDFNGSKVLGRFNNNFVYLKVKNLPDHNAVKIEFDLYIHDKWDGDYVAPGNTLPDAWVMNLDNYPFYITTFSNGSYRQSFPANYKAGGFPNPPKADAWETKLPGVCALQGSESGTSLYKIVKTTSHNKDSLVLTLNDVLQPVNSFCLKSWSLDNLIITATKY